jgi:proline dehydrogenase
MPAIKYRVTVTGDEVEMLEALLRKIECHYIPEHGSWLNIAEIGLAVLSNMRLSQRIPDEDTLRQQVAANVCERNAKASPVKWRFTIQDARRKLTRLFPRVSSRFIVSDY